MVSGLAAKQPIKQTGRIWCETRPLRTRIVTRACQSLIRRYGTPLLGNPGDSLDDLIYIILSNKTSPRTAQAVYDRLRSRYRSWDALLLAHPATLRSLLKPAGLSRVKSRQLRGTLAEIKSDFGACSLASLKTRGTQAVQEYLILLPGVSDKVAKCVMMYTMGAKVLPVDSHVHRIATRLGWTRRKRADQCHDELEALVPPRWRYAFHVGCVCHGRSVCRPRNPHCEDCCINFCCDYYRRAR